MANAHVTMLPSGTVKLEALTADITRKVTKDIFRDIQRRVPVDTGELLDSLEMEVVGLAGSITVGTDYWASVEYGSKPHYITSGGNYPLRSRETGAVFGRRVLHPGNPEQPFIRPAVLKKRKLG